MSVERNQPYPCGSGKKYKKCCLAKDQATARAAAAAAAQAAQERRQAEEAAQNAEWESQRQAWTEESSEELAADAPPATESAATEPDWPSLSDADQQLVDAWWHEVEPVYTGKEMKEQCGWLLERTLAFLYQQPRLFRYLRLHEEFLFEVGGALAHAGRMDDYLGLLRRLREEQPELYLQRFGFFDEDLLAEALRTGRCEDIPACLSLFRQHPIKHVDEFARVVNLLAWRGCEAELRELLEPTAQAIAESPQVIGGEFGLLWLTNLAIFPFLEAGDDSPEAMDRLCQAALAPGLLDDTDSEHREWLGRAVKMTSRPPAEAALDFKDPKNKWLQNDVGWNFTGWARRTKGLAWCSARFLAITLLDYWDWREKGKKSAGPFGLNKTQLDHYLAQGCRSFIGLDGVRALSTLQAFHYFTEYLLTHDYFSAAEAAQLQDAAVGFYKTVGRAVGPSDPAYRICPTYEALKTAPIHSERG